MSYMTFVSILLVLVLIYEIFLVFIKKQKLPDFMALFFLGLITIRSIFNALKDNDIISPVTFAFAEKIFLVSLMGYLVFRLVRWLKLPEKIKNMLGPTKKGE